MGLEVAYFYDTIVLAHLVNENWPSKELDWLTKNVLKDEGKIKSKAFQILAKKKGWGSIPATIMAEYAAHDAAMTLRLFEHLAPCLREEELMPMWNHKRDFMLRCLIPMAERGVRIDPELCRNKAAEGSSRLVQIVAELGLDPGKHNDLEELLLNRLGLAVVKRTEKGAVSFDKEAMEEYDFVLQSLDNPTAKLVKEFRGWQKAVSSNYLSYLHKVSPDGRLRCSYKLHGARTGRMSCSDPNLQQIPRKTDKDWNGEVKQCFVAEEGYQLWEFDYSQLELRLGTAYAKEKALLEVFQEGRDIFQEMADALGMERQPTKTFVYLTQYGGGVNRLSKSLGISRERAREIQTQYRNAYPGFHVVTERAKRHAEKWMKIPVWTGRFRHFQYADECRKAFNSIIQGGAADIVERTMLRCVDAGFNTDDCRMLLQVHDSIVFEIRDDLVEEYVPRIRECMEAVPDFDVRFAVESKEWGK
jgi:DNA polymerase-1